jgi:hypothetical protein
VAVFVALVAVALVIAVRLSDPKSLIEPLLAELSAQLERPIELGELDFSILPTPAVRLGGVRVGGTSSEAPPLIEVEKVRVKVAILPLFLGRVVLRALEVDAPRIYLELDAEGRPILPGRQGGTAAAAAAEAGIPSEQTEAAGPALAVQLIEIAEGSLVAGPWAVENLDLRGRLRLDRTAEVAFNADLPGLALLREGRVELEGLGSEEFAGSASLELREGELAALGARLELEPTLEGLLEGPVAISFGGEGLRAARVELNGTDLNLVSGELELQGDLAVEAELGGPWRLDLTRSRIAAGESFQKPQGLEASLSGTLGSVPDLTALQDALLKLGPNRLPLGLELGADPVRLRIEPTTLEVEPLASLVATGLEGLSGRVKLNSWQITPEPLKLSGSAELTGVRFELEHGPVSVSGPLSAEGTRLKGKGIRVLVGEQSATLSGVYDLSSQRLSLDGSLAGAELAALGQALRGSTDLAGALDAAITLKGTPGIATLAGTGNFEIRDGKIQGFSLLEQLLGDLAALPVLVAQLKGKDLSRYEEEEFKRLAADFRLRSGKLYTENLTLEYRHSTAQLHGSIGIVDGALDLGGRVVISDEVDAAIAGQASGDQKVIQIEGITGTVTRPRVRVDGRALAALAAGYTGQEGVREKLEEKLGKEGADAVEDILDRILRGEGR